VKLVVNAYGIVIDTVGVLLSWEHAICLRISDLDELVVCSALVQLGPEHVRFFTGANPSVIFTEDICARFERNCSCQRRYE
jgi:hypothetical protein